MILLFQKLEGNLFFQDELHLRGGEQVNPKKGVSIKPIFLIFIESWKP